VAGEALLQRQSLFEVSGEAAPGEQTGATPLPLGDLVPKPGDALASWATVVAATLDCHRLRIPSSRAARQAPGVGKPRTDPLSGEWLPRESYPGFSRVPPWPPALSLPAPFAMTVPPARVSLWLRASH
jgi:hypothetical protein